MLKWCVFFNWVFYFGWTVGCLGRDGAQWKKPSCLLNAIILEKFDYPPASLDSQPSNASCSRLDCMPVPIADFMIVTIALSSGVNSYYVFTVILNAAFGVRDPNFM